MGLGAASVVIRDSKAKSVAITDNVNGRLCFAWLPESSGTLFIGEEQRLDLTTEGLFVRSDGGPQGKVLGWAEDASGEKELIVESSMKTRTLIAEPELALYLADLAPSLARVSQLLLPWSRVAGEVMARIAAAVTAGETFNVDVFFADEPYES